MFTRSRLLKLLLVAVVLVAGWGAFLWMYARVEVEPDTFLVVTNRWGTELPDGELVAPDEAFKGIQRRVLPEGRHFLNPLFYTYERHQVVKVPEKVCAVLIRKSGIEVSAERKAKNEFLAQGAIDLDAAEKPGERGIVEQVLGPGKYRFNPYVYSIETVPAVEIESQQVGVKVLMWGREPPKERQSVYVVNDGERGVQKSIVPGGTHYINPYVARIVPVDVRAHTVVFEDIAFPSKDGFLIEPRVQVRYQVVAEKAPDLFVMLADNGLLHQKDETPEDQLKNPILQRVILPLIRGYVRIEGSKHDAREYISKPKEDAVAGAKSVNPRERLQEELMVKVKPECEKLGIIIDYIAVGQTRMNETLDELASQIRDREQARIARKTNEQKVIQYEQEKELKSTEKLSEQRMKMIEANTKLERAKIDAKRQLANVEAEQKANLDSARTKLEGAQKRSEAILTKGKADAAVIVSKNEAEVAAMKTAVAGFGSIEAFADYHILMKLAPLLSDVFASDTSDFAKLFSNYLTPRPSALGGPPTAAPMPRDKAAAGPEELTRGDFSPNIRYIAMNDTNSPDPVPTDPQPAPPAPVESEPIPPAAAEPTPVPAEPRRRRFAAAFSYAGGLPGRFGRGIRGGARGAGRRAAALRPSQPTLLLLLLVVVVVSASLTIRKYFLQHVPSGHMLVRVSKFGDPLAEGQILAGPGQKGVREQVLGEGWHIVWPVLYETELKENIVVPGQRVVNGVVEPPKVGIVKALGGTPLPPGEFLAEKGQQGIWREVLLPGSYRMNPYGFEVKLVDMVEVKPGYVGVLRRKLGADGPTEFAAKPNEKGIIRDRIFQPGLYPVNTEVFEIIPCPVGIYQTTYHYDIDESKNTALVFDASDSNRIQLDCTIEWELKPEHWPEWVAKFRSRERIESAVIMLNVKNISRNRGQDYGAEDFLDGVKREKFQTEFTNGLQKECKLDHVVVRNAFIRNIIIRDAFLKPKRDEQLAKEKAVTQKEQTLTASTMNDVVAAKQTIELEVAKVDAMTMQLVAAIEREASNLKIVTDAEVEKLKDEYAAKTSILESQREELLGKAKAEADKAVNTAKSGLHKMQMDVFANDSNAFLRYTLSQNLNPSLRLRLFQSGPGTFWTNLGDKAINLFAPLPANR